MIDDPALRDLFRSESEEHLQRLDEGLLRLETAPPDPALLEDMFREVHSLKGAARMLGLSDLEQIAHRFEDILGAARRGQSDLGSQLDRLGRAVQIMSRLSAEAVDGTPAKVDFGQALADLAGASPAEAVPAAGPVTPSPGQPPPEPPSEPSPTPEPPPTPSPPETPPGEPPPPTTIPPPIDKTGAQAYKIESVRVSTGRLDVLLTHSGELRVSRGRILRRADEAGEILDQVEERLRRRKALHSNADEEDAWLDTLHQRLVHLRRTLAEDSARLAQAADSLSTNIHEIRLLPFSTLFHLFPRLVHDLARDKGKRVELAIEGGELAADKRIIEVMKDALTHLLRNAIDHGIESAPERHDAGKPETAVIRLTAWRSASQIVIEVADDGRGLDTEAIRRAAQRQSLASEAELAAMTPEQIQTLIFAPGLSTTGFVTDTSGRGVGMDAARSSVESIKGSIELDSRPGAGLTVRMRLPVTLATARVLIVKSEGRLFALPTEHVRNAMFVAHDRLFSIEGRQMLESGHEVLPAHSLARLLELPPPAAGSPGPPPARLACVVVATGGQAAGLLVDELVGEDEVMLRMQGGLLRRVRNVSCATLLEDGEVCPVLNLADLLKTALRNRSVPQAPAQEIRVAEATPRRRLLLVEDSLTTRTQEKRILEAAGYEVVTAVDGVDAYARLGQAKFDAVVSDVNMPNMDGLALTERIRQDKHHHDLPVVLVTSLSSEDDKRRGMEVGADAYITKPAFDQRMLLESLQRLL